MNEPRATIRVGSRKKTYVLYGREALKFKVWWDNGPVTNKAGKPYKAEFYEGGPGIKGYTFEPIIGRGGIHRRTIVVTFEGI